MPANKTFRPADSVPPVPAVSRSRRAGLREAEPFPEFITVGQFCALIGISRSTFYDWRAKGKAPECHKWPNGDLRIERQDLAEWLKRRRAA